MTLISGIGVGSGQGRATILDDLNKVYSELHNDKEFIIKGTHVHVGVKNVICFFVRCVHIQVSGHTCTFSSELSDAEKKYCEKVQLKESNKSLTLDGRLEATS